MHNPCWTSQSSYRTFICFLFAGSLGFLTPAAGAAQLQNLYVGNDNAAAQVLQYNLPLTASATANLTMTASGNVVAVAVDANGNLMVGQLSGNLQFFPAPLSGASTSTATFKNGTATNNGQSAFLSTGDVWGATVSNRANRFNTPFSNASTPAAFVTDPAMVSVIGAAVDPAQNLYLSNAGTGTAAACVGTSNPGGGCGSNLFVYAPPYTGAPIITPNVINFPFAGNGTAYRKITVNGTRLYAASVANSPGRVDVYNLPLTATSTPAFALTTGVNTPEGLALDASGNLYIGNLGDTTVSVYTAPITAGSVPSVIYKVSTGGFAIFGIAVGNSPLLRGDTNGDGAVTVADVFYLVNYLYAGGPAPIGSGDVNSDSSVSVADVFYLVNYLFTNGPAPGP